MHTGEGKRRRGRPKYYTPESDMEIVVGIEERMAKHGLKTYSVCLRFGYDTQLDCFDGSPEHHTIRGETLRSRYQRVIRDLRKEQERFDAHFHPLLRLETRGIRELMQLPTVIVWKRVLQARLAAAGFPRPPAKKEFFYTTRA
jgi:hypothetical protein